MTSHVIVTSKTAARLLARAAAHFQYSITTHSYLAVGAQTAQELRELGCTDISTALQEQQEGIMALIEADLSRITSLFYAHSAKSRSDLSSYIQATGLPFIECILYDVRFIQLPIDLDTIDGLYFTSPSTVESFFSTYTTLPKNLALYSQGPITKKALQEKGLQSTLWTHLSVKN